MESAPNWCRYEDKCHSKTCTYNHPNRPDCRYGNNCSRQDCYYYNHEIILCRFSTKCSNKQCKFRHMSQDNNNITKEFPSVGATASTTTIKHQLYELREARAIQRHNKCISKIEHRINSILSSVHGSTQDSQLSVEVLEGSIAELRTQLQVYETVKSRAVENLKSNESELRHQIKREIYRLESRLGAFAKRLEIEKYIDVGRRFFIVQGQTGSGKSTQIPQYVADHPKFSGKRIICTQPRKIATIALAQRVAFEYSGGSTNSVPGYQIGYQVGGQKKVGNNYCRIEFVTEGVMLERIMKGGPDIFKNVGCIIIDEAHERSIICDLLLGLFKKCDRRWEDVMIIATSATIDLNLFSSFFYDAPCLEIEGRTFPVDIIYYPLPESSNIRTAVALCALQIHCQCKNNPGDILCFLPGQEDVLLAKTFLEGELGRIRDLSLLEANVLVLYGRQDPEQQALVFEKMPPTKRKIIFSTDIAETSITIDGVVYVVDSGVKKELVFDPKRNISSLKVTNISKSSAIQRAGRSGRTQPGVCYRLYSQDDFENSNINTAPEIFRKPLSLAILTIREMGIDPLKFDWISAPSKEAILAAKEELLILGAIDNHEKLTELGKTISDCQQDPKLVRMVYFGCQKEFGLAAATIGAILTVSNMFYWNGNDAETKSQAKIQRLKYSLPEGDIVSMYRLFQEWLDIYTGKTNYAIEFNEDLQSIENNSRKNDIDLLLNLPNIVSAASWKSNDENDLGDSDDESIAASETSESTEDEIIFRSVQEKFKFEKQSKKNCKKEAFNWCRNHWLNGKAMTLALAARDELVSSFKQTKVWRDKEFQTKEPTNSEIQKLVFEGYFIHVARLVLAKNSGESPQYYALHSEVSGKLDYRAAILNAPDNTLPKWIIYDKILKLSTTIFPTTNVIEESWLEESHPAFYKKCLLKTLSLPTEMVIKSVSQECLRTIVGKNYCNLESLEKLLECMLEVDYESGRLTLYCVAQRKDRIEELIQMRIDIILNEMKNQVAEEQYLNGTRVIIGQGYEVKDVLFQKEFSTIYIRNIPLNYSREELKTILTKCNEVIGTLEFIEEKNSCSATVKFCSKKDAKSVYERLLRENIAGQSIAISTSNSDPPRGVTQGLSCRLKLSWALGKSTGKAKICFRIPEQANRFIANIYSIFPSAKISRVHGVIESQNVVTPRANKLESTSTSIPIKKEPPLEIIRDARGPRYNRRTTVRYKFDVRRSYRSGNDYNYLVTVNNLGVEIDEFTIYSVLRHYHPKWIKVVREKADSSSISNSGESILLDRVKKLEPLSKFITGDTVTTDFFESNLCRAGIYLYFKNDDLAKNAFNQSNSIYKSMGHCNGQPYRLEMDFAHSVSINQDLYTFLNTQMTDLMLKAKQRGISCTQLPPRNKSRFIVLKFQTCQMWNISWVQQQVDDITSFTEFPLSSEKSKLLFNTWTGKMQIMELTANAYIQWNEKRHVILLYGSSRQQKEVIKSIEFILKTLSSLEVFDEDIVLDKKKINGHNCLKITETCKKLGIKYYHFLGCKLYVSGTRDSVNSIKRYIDEQKLSRCLNKSRNINKDVRQCELCFDTPDGKFIMTSLCGHVFCLECIQPMFDELPFPVKCPICQIPIALNDIIKCCPPRFLQKILEIAVLQFQEKHSLEIIKCPKVGCGQLLSCHEKINGNITGETLFCDNCLTMYCITCSDKLDKPVKSHDGDRCQDIQSGTAFVIFKHVRAIQETVLNLNCPKCKTVFYEFEGCAAVTCAKCQGGFCGMCLQECGSDAHTHEHVRNCPVNPKKNEYFVDKVTLNAIHREMKVTKLRMYLEMHVKDLKIRQGVLTAISRDLADVGIHNFL